jgi:hypothetical protein
MTTQAQDVMVDVVDKMKDHFNETNELPNLKFKVEKFGHLPFSKEYRDKNEDPSDIFTANVFVKYTNFPSGVEAEHHTCAFDNVYLNLNTKVDKKKLPTKN